MKLWTSSRELPKGGRRLSWYVGRTCFARVFVRRDLPGQVFTSTLVVVEDRLYHAWGSYRNGARWVEVDARGYPSAVV